MGLEINIKKNPFHAYILVIVGLVYIFVANLAEIGLVVFFPLLNGLFFMNKKYRNYDLIYKFKCL